MTNADGRDQVSVAPTSRRADAVDPNYNGPVTLAVRQQPRQRRSSSSPAPRATSTLTANAVNGVADFSPIMVNAVGFGYTLQATAAGLTARDEHARSTSTRRRRAARPVRPAR